MPSVLELLGLKVNTQQTSIPPLGIDSPLNRLQTQSKKYFLLNEDAKAADGNVLAIAIQSGQHFSLLNSEHKEYIQKCTQLFKEKVIALKAIDQNIVWGSIIGIVASSLSFVPLVGYFSLLGWGFALYNTHQRVTALTEYREALNLLVVNCNWALGQAATERTSEISSLTQDSNIREMMTALYPVLTETQVRHLIADDIEEAFTQELRDYESKYRLISNSKGFFGSLADESIAHSKRGAEFYRCIYGYNKGKPTDYLDAFFSIFPDVYNLVCDGFKYLQNWFTKKENVAQPAVSASKQAI